MKLGKFINKYIAHNSLIRLHYKTEIGTECVLNEGRSNVCMEWEITDDKGKYNYLYNYKVSCIKDIGSSNGYIEAINIIIYKKSVSDIRNEKLNKILS